MCVYVCMYVCIYVCMSIMYLAKVEVDALGTLVSVGWKADQRNEGRNYVENR